MEGVFFFVDLASGGAWREVRCSGAVVSDQIDCAFTKQVGLASRSNTLDLLPGMYSA
jgi:hypothetical protein